jgi:hypothetical protein
MISREELIFLGKNNPKLFWKELQTRKKQTENNITACQWFEYAKQLYEQDPKVDTPPLVNTTTKLFIMQEIEVGIKKLGVGKEKDLVELQAEYLKMGFKNSCTSHYENFQQHHSAGIPYRLDNESSNTTFQEWGCQQSLQL